MLAGIEPEHPHVFGPMGSGFHDDGDVVTGLESGQRALARWVFPILSEDFVDGDRHGRLLKQ